MATITIIRKMAYICQDQTDQIMSISQLQGNKV